MGTNSNGNYGMHAQDNSLHKAAGTRSAAREIVLPKGADKANKHHSGSFLLLVVALLIVLIVGMCLGHYIQGLPFPSFGAQGAAASQTLTEDSVKQAIATYELDGKRVDVLAKDVIAQKRSLDSSKSDDGTYAKPSAEEIMGYIRTQLLKKDAADQGIDVSDDEVSEFAKNSLGTDDMSLLAKSYGMDENNVKELLRTSVILDKLRKQVVTTKIPTLPSVPKPPAAGKEQEPSAEYAKYIIDLAGDEWDSSADTWKSKDSALAQGLSKFKISSKGATYDAVRIAYSLALQKANQVKQASDEEWRTYVNKTFSRVTVTLNTLGA